MATEPVLGGPTSIVDTACPLDCPDACTLSVKVQHGKVISLDGSRRNPVTDGYICAKVRKFDQRLYGPDRLLHPAVRRGRKGEGRFKRVTWDEALELIVDRFRHAKASHGGASILPFSYGGSNGLLTQDNLDAQLWRRFGTSRLARTLCAAPTGVANQTLYGKMPSVTYQDYPDARLIILWGVNPSASGIHLVPYVRTALKRGAKLVVIDPRTTMLARAADIHLPVKPGTDLAVALAIHRFLFTSGLADGAFLHDHTRGADQLRERAEEWTLERAAAAADIDPLALEQVARLYGESSPALIRCGWGLERNRNGGSAAMAVLALPAVGGKFGVRGGGYSMSNSASWDITRPWIASDEPDTRVVNMNLLGRALTEYDDPPVNLLFVYNCNPAATVPDQRRVIRGLEREDLFTVVFEQVMTDTALYADLVLPATTFLEGYDFAKAYGPINMELAVPVIEPTGEARSNADVFGELCARLGLLEDDEPKGELDLMLQVLGALPGTIGNDLGAGKRPLPPFGDAPIQFVDVFPNTPDGKVELYSAALDISAPVGLYRLQPDPGSERYPLALISPASDRTISSTLGELPRGDAKLTMHPDDAGTRSLSDGDLVRVFNDLGEVHCALLVNRSVRRGTVSLPKGLWRRSTRNGATATALAPDTLTDLGGGACFNDARVQVVSLPTA
ncbi:MAG TPA: molybdopterin-dependent oxidoreductase [Vicinamibacterales bacterium]|jgi:anaerobic selenocysteine-containing dehydrogenase|nr:molybdopterin-dependent oxidoreductase [Vicinamibacterales bacterium]